MLSIVPISFSGLKTQAETTDNQELENKKEIRNILKKQIEEIFNKEK